MRRLVVSFVAVMVVSLTWLAGGVSPALSVSPWWHLAVGSRPANIQPGSARSEVQEVTVNATGGEFALANLTSREVQEFVEGKITAEGKFEIFPHNASAVVVQKGLEVIYGAGNVEVSGGPVGEESKPYRVMFKGALTDQPVSVMNTELTTIFGLLEGTEKVTEGVKGRADGEVVVLAENVGDGSVDGGVVPMVVSDVLPFGVKALAISASGPELGQGINSHERLPCSLEQLSCTLSGVLPEYQTVELRIAVLAEPGVAGDNVVSVSGGGAPSTVVRRALRVNGQETLFGVENYELTNELEGGAPDTQAGSHPFQQTTTLVLNQEPDSASVSENPHANPAGLVKDLSFKWPPGLIGNPEATPKCTLGQFTAKIARLNEAENECAANTAVGVAAVSAFEPGGLGLLTFTVPLFNLEPAVGEPARFGFFVPLANVPVVIDTAVRTGGDYGVTVSVHSVSQTAAFVSSQVTVWGAPGDPRHDSARGWACLQAALHLEHEPCSPLGGHTPPPFLTLPTSCVDTPVTTVTGDSWSEPGVFQEFPGAIMPALNGCDRLPFSSSIKVSPDGQAASTPTGLNVDVHVPQEVSQNPEGLASSNIKDIMVTLPEGIVLNPAAADGLQACNETQIGFTGMNASNGTPEFTPGEPACPDASKVATVKIHTPLLPNSLEGAVYLATPAPNGETGMNPFNTLIALYIVAKDPVSGTLVKLPGRVSLDPTTGRISSTFEHNPQLPFEDAELHFFGGDRAPLTTPSHCGTDTTEALFTPWSGNPPIVSQSSFSIISGPNGTPCPATLPFAPSLAAGMININAGSFSPLSTTISRDDGNQNIRSVQLHMPPGLSGILTGVALCPEAQANAGTCGPGSLIGHTIVSVGLGGDPFTVTGGQVFLTEKYGGGQFGLSIVNPAKAGPFDLGKVIVRASINVDPHTAALTVTTGEIPHILQGIPLQIKHVNVTIDRPDFTFNPTNCGHLAVTGTINSTEGATSTVGVPFQVTNCAVLKFAPKFSVSTSGKTSRARGASLTARLSYPKAPQGTQTNITRVMVDLPKQLPSRLTTLQKACTNIQFETNPANCPAASKIGQATVTTPLLPVALHGPAIFVSHGGEAFPSLTMVLQGYGVTVDLVGTTFISRKGITSTTFKTVPDVPFNTFTLTLPQGKYSALAANGNLCKTKLGMPTEFLAQNGLAIHQTTKITVTNCTKHHTTRHHTRKRHTTQHKTSRHTKK